MCASSETPPAGDVILALTTDEETGSRTGMKFLVEEHADLFSGVRHALSEFGGYTLWHGSRRFVPIQVAEKQRCLIRATVAGREDMLRPSCAARRARSSGSFFRGFASRRLPVHVTPVARLMLEAMAKELPRHEQLAIRGLFSAAGRRAAYCVYSAPPDACSHRSLCNTATPTVFEAAPPRTSSRPSCRSSSMDASFPD